MATKPLVPVEEYLRTKFDGPDPEYLDGELVERNLGEFEHGAVQVRLAAAFLRLRKPLCVASELHLRITPSRYRIVDLAVFLEKPATPIPTSPPYVAIEIVSPGDRYTEIHKKLEEYRSWGVRHIWLVDPGSTNFSIYDEAGLREVPAFVLADLELTIAKTEIFE
jgi:Uma2 family endonuclease